MADGRRNNGGHRTAGRKPKATELELIDRLSPFDDLALAKLVEGMEKGDYRFIKTFLEYRFGKPKDISLEKAAESFGNLISLGSGKKD